MGCESPQLDAVIIRDTISWRLDPSGDPMPSLYQIEGQGQPAIHLSADASGNQRWLITDSKGLSGNSTAELAPGDIAQVAARDHFFLLNNATAAQELKDTLQFDTTSTGAKMIANTFTSTNTWATVTITIPFLCAFDNLKATLQSGQGMSFGRVYLGVKDIANAPSFGIKLIDCKGTAHAGPTISNFSVNDKLEAFNLSFTDFFGAGNISTASMLKRETANIVVEINMPSAELVAYVGTALVGTNPRALVP
jgi:hypothetical protein